MVNFTFYKTKGLALLISKVTASCDISWKRIQEPKRAVAVGIGGPACVNVISVSPYVCIALCSLQSGFLPGNSFGCHGSLEGPEDK